MREGTFSRERDEAPRQNNSMAFLNFKHILHLIVDAFLDAARVIDCTASLAVTDDTPTYW